MARDRQKDHPMQRHRQGSDADTAPGPGKGRCRQPDHQKATVSPALNDRPGAGSGPIGWAVLVARQ